MKNNNIIVRNCFLTSNLAVFLALLVPPASFAHEVRVHEAITYGAWASAAQSSPNYQAFSLTITPPDGSGMFFSGGTNRSDVEWLAQGSAREDDEEKLPAQGGHRPLNHFYDPLSGQGLSEEPPGIITPLGRDSFDWAWLFNSPGVDLSYNIGTVNQWSWQNARGFEWTGLTYPDPAARSDNLAKTFRALGDVIHLLQDTTQPQHVRNEQHLSYW